MIKKLGNFLTRLAGYGRPIAMDQSNKERIDSLKILLARSILQSRPTPTSIKEAELQVFSQFGEDGIVQMLIEETRISAKEEIFVEIGVENFEEANTRFLLINDNWSGLVIDQSEVCIQHIRQSSLAWRHDLRSQCLRVTRENVNQAILSAGFSGTIGLLSIDIDGNDYWVWEHVSAVDPIIVVIEYNSLFGHKRCIAVPYDPDFSRENAHYSWLYWGASAAALVELGNSKGYAFVGANSSGNNLFFVKRERLGRLKERNAQEGFVRAKFRDSRSRDGALSFLGVEQQEAAVQELEIHDLKSNRLTKLADIFKDNLS